MSFIQPEAQVFDAGAANVMAKFCHFVFFFASRASGERWVAKHPDTFLYSLDDAFALAQRLNARNFGRALAERARSRAPAESTPRRAAILVEAGPVALNVRSGSRKGLA